MNKRNRDVTYYFKAAQTAESREDGPSTQAAESMGEGPSTQETDSVSHQGVPHVAAQLGPGDVESDPGLRIHHRTLCRLLMMWKPVLKKNQNIVRAVGLIKTTLEKIQDIREDGWDELLKEVTDFCVKYNIVMPNMEDTRTANGRSRTWGGELVTYYHYFRNEIFNVVHDQLIVELNNRFAERSTQLLRCISCLDPRNSFANYDEDKLVDLANMYVDDFSTYEVNFVLRNQLDSFIIEARADPYLMNCNDLGHLAMKMVLADMHTTFPLVYRLVELALILPVATAIVERAFSAMSIIKTGLRNRMGDDWMNHRMVCYIERDIFVSIEESKIIERFQGYRSRKGILPRRRSLASSTIEDVVMGSSNPPNP